MSRKMITKITALLVVTTFLLVPASIQPRQKTDMAQATCCCCETSSQLSQPNDAKQHECPCQLSEKEPVESSPAVVVSYDGGGPESLLPAAEVELSTGEHIAQAAGSYYNHFLLLNKNRALYLLNESFLC
jgi:hypothetical protein